LCLLLGSSNPSQLISHSQRGAIFENWVINEVHKQKLNHHQPLNTYFWRDSKGLEVDLLIDQGETIYPIEIKSGATVASDWLGSLEKFTGLAQPRSSSIIYGGDKDQKRSLTQIFGWKSLSAFLQGV
jgi:predicted AAA+ superfamily ATPase